MNENELTRRSFLKTFFLGGMGLFLSIFGMKSKNDKKKQMNDLLPNDSVFKSRDQI